MAKTSQARSNSGKSRSQAQDARDSGSSPRATDASKPSMEGEPNATDEDEEDLDPELDALVGLAQMDLEAAAAYEIVAESVEERRISEMLRGFAEDHRRHVAEIRTLVTELGGDPVFASPDPEISTFVTVAAAASQFGQEAGLRALVASEQFTNSTYEAALELAVTSGARAIVERNFADEQRHLQALTQALQRAKQAEVHSAD